MNLDLAVSTIMTPNVTTVSRDQKLVDIKHIYEQKDFHSHIPVVEDEKIVGIISLVNFMRAIHNASLDDNETVYQEMIVKDIMTPHPVTIPSDSSIREAVELLAEGQFHSILVTKDNQLVGLVSTTDLMRQLLED